MGIGVYFARKEYRQQLEEMRTSLMERGSAETGGEGSVNGATKTIKMQFQQMWRQSQKITVMERGEQVQVSWFLTLLTSVSLAILATMCDS